MPDDFARPQAPWALRLLPPFPAIAQRVLAIAALEDVSVHELSDLVRMDPSFSAELLRFANSPIFGMRREVTSLSHAILVAGTEKIKTMATVVALNRMVRSCVRIQALRKVWVHSLATAIIAEEAARLAGLSMDEAYTAGMLHNLGVLGLMSAYPDEYSRMLAVSDDFGFDLLATERDLFEIDHCAAGAYLAQDWNFPDELAAVIASHHDAPESGERTMYNLIATSWRLTDALGFAAFSPAVQWSWNEIIGLLPGGSPSWLTPSAEEAHTQLSTRLSHFPV